MCGRLHLLSNKVLPEITSLPISHNGILIDTHLKTPLQHQCKGRWQVQRTGKGEGHVFVCMGVPVCVQLVVGATKRGNDRKSEGTGDRYIDIFKSEHKSVF